MKLRFHINFLRLSVDIVNRGNGYETRQSSLLYVIVLFLFLFLFTRTEELTNRNVLVT